MNKVHTITEVTPGERRAWEERLSRWHTLAEMKKAVDELHAKLPNVVLFNQPGLSFARESWDAVEFARARGDEAVRLVNDGWPDFETRNADGVHRFEHVLADLPGRLRGQEYKQDAEKLKRGSQLFAMRLRICQIGHA